MEGNLGDRKTIPRLHILFLIRKIDIKKIEMDNFTLKELWLKRCVNLTLSCLRVIVKALLHPNFPSGLGF